MQLGLIFLCFLLCAIVFIFIEMLRIVFTSEDAKATYSYEGSKDDRGKPHGQGTLHLPNGDSYEGSFSHGHFDGHGQYCFLKSKSNGGGRYIGEFPRKPCYQVLLMYI
jgi:hypothetical protein